VTMLDTSQTEQRSLTERGLPVHADRAAWHRTPRLRNAVALASACAQSYGVCVAAAVVDTWWSYVGAVVLLARGVGLLFALGHEAMHSGLLGVHVVDRWIARWLIEEAQFERFAPSRRAHAAHHRDAYGTSDRTAAFTMQFPVSRRRFHRILFEDLCFVTAWRGTFRPIAWTLVHRPRVALPTIAWHVGAGSVALAVGRPFAYVVWLVAWGTVGQLAHTLRVIGEHGGLRAGADHRRDVHLVRQNRAARVFLVPHHLGYHLAHHMDPAIPWTRLPAYERLLVEEGFIDPSTEWPNYRAVWRWCASG
jgi:fatty acid desaturase